MLLINATKLAMAKRDLYTVRCMQTKSGWKVLVTHENEGLKGPWNSGNTWEKALEKACIRLPTKYSNYFMKVFKDACIAHTEFKWERLAHREQRKISQISTAVKDYIDKTSISPREFSCLCGVLPNDIEKLLHGHDASIETVIRALYAVGCTLEIQHG